VELAQCWHRSAKWHEIHGSGPMGCDTDCWWPCPLWVPVTPSAFGRAVGLHRLRSVNEPSRFWQGVAWTSPKSLGSIFRQLGTEIDRLDRHIAQLYDAADPKGIVASAPV